MKEAHCALLSLMVEAARIDLSSDSLHKFLEIQVNWPQARCKKLCDAYFTIIPKLQALLINSSQHPPHIVDIQWRLDHNIKVGGNGKIITNVFDAFLSAQLFHSYLFTVE